MILGKVTGTVWGSREARTLDGAKIVQVQPVRLTPGEGMVRIDCATGAESLSESLVLAVDGLGAGIGEFVLVGHGSRIRDLTVGTAVPVKDVVLAIVDRAVYDAASVAAAKGAGR